MTGLRTPVKTALRKTTTTESVHRMWYRIEARGRERPVSSRRMAPLLAAVVAVLLGVVVAWRVRSTETPIVATTVGAVAQEDGSPLGVIKADHGSLRLGLSDGTHLLVAAGATLRPIRNADDSVVLEQDTGTVTYDIVPGGPRRWTIQCGPATIEVVGTSFEVDRGDARVRVVVTRGVVIVRGDALAEGMARLTAGMAVEVPTRPAAAVTAPVEPATVSSQLRTPAQAKVPPPASPVTGRVSEGWRQLAREGDNDRAYAELGAAGIARESTSGSIDDLFALADVARLSGHAVDAVEPLQRIVADHQEDARTAVAALTLGRIQLKSLMAPSAAARSLDKAIALGVPAALSEDTYALLIEALSQGGEHQRARAVYERFNVLFPGSSRSPGLARWVQEP